MRRHLRRLTRTPLAFWPASLALAALTGLLVARLVGEAEARVSRYGHLATVAVVAREVPTGQVVGPRDVRLRRFPLALLPTGYAADDVVGRTALTTLFPGEPVLKAKLAPWGVRGLGALLPPGTRGVTVPTGRARAPLRRGDLVDVLAPTSASTAGALAEEALVLAVGDEGVTLAVASEEAAPVAFAAAQGTVTLAIVSPLMTG